MEQKKGEINGLMCTMQLYICIIQCVACRLCNVLAKIGKPIDRQLVAVQDLQAQCNFP